MTRSLEVLWLTVPLPLLMPEGRVVAPLLLPLLVVVVAGRLVVGLLTWVLVVLVGRVVVVVVTLFEPELLWLTVLLPILEPVGREVELLPLLVVVVAGRLVAGLLTWALLVLDGRVVVVVVTLFELELLWLTCGDDIELWLALEVVLDGRVT